MGINQAFTRDTLAPRSLLFSRYFHHTSTGQAFKLTDIFISSSSPSLGPKTRMPYPKSRCQLCKLDLFYLQGFVTGFSDFILSLFSNLKLGLSSLVTSAMSVLIRRTSDDLLLELSSHEEGIYD